MEMKKGLTTIEFLGIFVALWIFLFFIGLAYVVGNKQVIDFNHQKFNIAYVRADSNNWERVKIKAWKDWNDSDTVKIIKQDGSAIYTHLCNMKLCVE